MENSMHNFQQPFAGKQACPPMGLGVRPPNRRERRAAAARARVAAGLPVWTPGTEPGEVEPLSASSSLPLVPTAQPLAPTAQPLAPTAQPFTPSATAKPFTPSPQPFITSPPAFVPTPQRTDPISYFPNPTPNFSPAYNPAYNPMSMTSTPSYTPAPNFTPAFTPAPASSVSTPPSSASSPAEHMCQVIVTYHTCGCRAKPTFACRDRTCKHERLTQANVGKLPFPCTAKWTGNSTPGAGASPVRGRGPACHAPDPGSQGWIRDMGMGLSFGNKLLVLKRDDGMVVELEDLVEALPEGVAFEDWAEELKKTCAGRKEAREEKESMVQVSTQTETEKSPRPVMKDAATQSEEPEMTSQVTQPIESDIIRDSLEEIVTEMMASRGTQPIAADVIKEIVDLIKGHRILPKLPVPYRVYIKFLLQLSGYIA